MWTTKYVSHTSLIISASLLTSMDIIPQVVSLLRNVIIEGHFKPLGNAAHILSPFDTSFYLPNCIRPPFYYYIIYRHLTVRSICTSLSTCYLHLKLHECKITGYGIEHKYMEVVACVITLDSVYKHIQSSFMPLFSWSSAECD